MALRLVDDDLDISLDLPLDPQTRQALGIQMQRYAYTESTFWFGLKLVEQFRELIDADLKPPTASQLSYALSIARALGISLPGEALQFRGAMCEFIGRHASLFKERSDIQGKATE